MMSITLPFSWRRKAEPHLRVRVRVKVRVQFRLRVRVRVRVRHWGNPHHT